MFRYLIDDSQFSHTYVFVKFSENLTFRSSASLKTLYHDTSDYLLLYVLSRRRNTDLEDNNRPHLLRVCVENGVRRIEGAPSSGEKRFGWVGKLKFNLQSILIRVLEVGGFLSKSNWLNFFP